MVKLVKKSVIFCLGVVMFGLMPTMVDAAAYSWGTPTKENNITRIPIVMKIEESDAVSNFKASCSTKDLDVTCEINQLSSTTTISVYEGLYTYVGADTTDVNFPVGEYKLIEVVLTNNDTSKKSEVEVTLNGSIGGVTKSLTTNISVGAKEAEKEYSTDATLSDIKLSQGILSPEFSKDNKEYTVYQIPDTINKIKITPVCNDAGKCTFDITGGKSVSGSYVTLNVGENNVVIDVTSEDGNNTNTYKLTVIRGETTYNSSRLGELSFGDYVLTPSFAPATKKYALTVPNEVTTLAQIIKYSTEDADAKEFVKVEGIDNFVVGENKLTITVSNVMADETTVYEIVVTRLSEENIEILKYINDEVTFKDSDGIQTTLKMEEFKKTYPTEYEKITKGEYKFDEEGNKIIAGLEEDQDTEEDEDKKDKKKDNKIWIIIALIAVGLIVIIVSGILIFRKKKPEEEEVEEKETTKEEHIETKVAEPVAEEDTMLNPLDETSEFDETGIEEAIVGEKFSNTMETTVDIDEALSDLMSTKQYEFKDKE